MDLKKEFNPATQKYELILPLKKSKEKTKFNWIKFVGILLGIIILAALFYILSRKVN